MSKGAKAGIAILALLVLVAIISAGSRPTPIIPDADMMADTSAGNMAIDGAMTANMSLDGEMSAGPELNVADPVPASPWTYTTDEDKVRGGTSYFAATTSTNSIHQDAPYDSATTMRMTVRHMPSSDTDVVLTVSSGQMMCPSYEGCTGTMRFDDGPAQSISFNGPADNSSDTIFVEGASSFIAKLKKAKRVVIEKTLYEAGNPQFEFDVQGLDWKH